MSIRMACQQLLAAVLLSAGSFGQTAGAWKLNPARSTFAGDTQPRHLTLRIEPHVKGEVFTLERIEPDGRVTTSSMLLYLDGVARAFPGGGCSGTQSSRRVDSQTVEILRNCGGSAWTRFVRQTAAKQNEVILEITEQHADGHRFERRLVLEKRQEGK